MDGKFISIFSWQIIQICINSARVMAINLGEKERIYHETMQSPIKIMLALDLISDRLKQQVETWLFAL